MEEETARRGKKPDRGMTREKERRVNESERERKREAKRKGVGERKRDVGGCSRKAVGVEVTGLWSRRDVASVGGEERRWRRTAVSRPRGK